MKTILVLIVGLMLAGCGSILKAAKGKVLTVELINNIFADFRAIPSKLNW